MPLQSDTKSFEWRSQSTLHSFPRGISPILTLSGAESYSCQLLLYSYFLYSLCQYGSWVRCLLSRQVLQSCHLDVVLVLHPSSGRVLPPPGHLQVWGSSQAGSEEGSLTNGACFLWKLAFAFLIVTHHPPDRWWSRCPQPPLSPVNNLALMMREMLKNPHFSAVQLTPLLPEKPQYRFSWEKEKGNDISRDYRKFTFPTRMAQRRGELVHT